MPRPPRALLVASLLAAAACGTTVPAAQQQVGSGGAGLGGSSPVTTDSGSTSGDGQVIAGGSTGGGTTGSTGLGTSTGGATSTTGATSPIGTTGSAPAPTGTIPTAGRGWDAKHVYIGIPTANDFDTVARAAGASGGGNGSTEGDVNAVVADINRTGGLFGRQVVPVFHDVKTTDMAYQPAATAQEVCTYFTQDHPVIGVVNGSPQFDAQATFHSCLEKAGVSLLSLSNTDFGDADYRRLGPHLWTTASLSTDLLVPAFVSALQRQGYFSGWDTLSGTPRATKAKVGLLLPDSSQGHHVASVMTAALSHSGQTVASTFFYDVSGLGTASSSEVLRFKSAGVTHVLDLPAVAAEVWFFQRSAEQQKYRPRYGFTSFNLPMSVEENSGVVPPVQQIGSIGIGWQPYNDVNAAHDAGTSATPGSKRCLTALKRGSIRFGPADRRAALIASQLCDAIYLLRDAAVAGHGLTAAALLAGAPRASFTPAGTFRSDLTPSNHGVPGYYRDQHYDAGCSCFVYSGGNHRFR